MRNGSTSTTYCLSATGVCPTQGVHERLALIETVAVLSVVLVNIERQQRCIDGRVCVERLKDSGESQRPSTSRGLHTSTSTRLALRSWSRRWGGKGGGSFRRESIS